MSTQELVETAQATIGYAFRDPNLLLTALTHASLVDRRQDSNERLEFLGDAVLGLVVCSELYHRNQDWLEGDLTKVKSHVVSRRVCAKVADDHGLTQLLLLGNGVAKHVNLPVSLKAAVYESITGAIYLDGGLAPAQDFILRTILPYIEKSSRTENQENYKSALQQFVQRWLQATPHYEALDEQGPDHSKCFEVCVVIDGKRYPGAWGANKKDAEQEAAHRALELLKSSLGRGNAERGSEC